MAKPEHSTIAKSALINARVEVEHPVHIGPRVEFQGGSLGRYAFINADTLIYQNVHIGRFVTFARGCQIGGVEHPIHHLATSFFGVSNQWFPDDPIAQNGPMRRNGIRPDRERRDRIDIGNDVWFGAGAIVLKGVKIGDGAVIGAGSVVTKDIQPYAIVAGNPARLIRYRFNPPTVERLLESKWWDLPAEVIRSLPLDDISAALDRIEAMPRTSPLPDTTPA